MCDRPCGPDDLLGIAVDYVARRLILLRHAWATFVNGDVRPRLSVAVDITLKGAPIRMVHAPVGLGVNRDPHRMDGVSYSAIRFPAGGVARLLNGAGASDPTCKETGNTDSPDNVRFNPDIEPDLFTECGEAVLRRHARGRPRSSCRP